jgi:hypothetical protein
MGHMEKCRDFWSINTRNRVDAQIYTHHGHNPEELVFRIRYVQGDKKMEGIDSEIQTTFTFEHESPSIYATLQVIRTKIFSEVETMEVVPISSAHKANMSVHKLLEFYNVTKEEHEEEDPRNVQIPDTKG